MSDIEQFSGYEVVRAAMEVEGNGHRFYATMAQRASSELARELFTWLAQDEIEHLRRLRSIESRYQDGAFLDGAEEFLPYLRRFADSEIFPSAEHHVCIFHALKWVHRQLRDIYGTDKTKSDPAVVALRQAIDDIFDTRTKRTAQRRYEAVMALRDTYVVGKPEVAAVFDSLEEHWPKLVNAIESDLIPTTNNAVELVIRRFDQHYQK
jgi:rubrerythrin